MASTFLVVSVFRGASLRFVNDHFTHLSRARQMLLGEWPLRDFFDPGQFLHYGLSAVVLALWGDSLFGEAILTVGFLALGASLIFGASYTLARSTRVAIAMTILSVIALPRLYNYPKVVLYPAALWVGWWFGTRATPRGRHLLVLAATTVIAALFRYDHGVYIGGAFGVWGVVARWRVGGHANELLQKLHLFVKVRVDPGVELGIVGRRGAHAVSFAS